MGIKRYTVYEAESPIGEYVLYEDIKHLLMPVKHSLTPAQIKAVDSALKTIASVYKPFNLKG